jgi:F0F1-type ATP synthase membrane subunit b/b'
MNAEIAKAKTEADASASAAMHAADARITATREQAKVHVANAARDAAIAIVARLTGETVSPEDAAKAVGG